LALTVLLLDLMTLQGRAIRQTCHTAQTGPRQLGARARARACQALHRKWAFTGGGPKPRPDARARATSARCSA